MSYEHGKFQEPGCVHASLSVDFKFESDDPFFAEEEPRMTKEQQFVHSCIDSALKLDNRDKQILFSHLLQDSNATRDSVARELGITRAAVSKRVRIIAEQYPALGKILHYHTHHTCNNWAGRTFAARAGTVGMEKPWKI